MNRPEHPERLVGKAGKRGNEVETQGQEARPVPHWILTSVLMTPVAAALLYVVISLPFSPSLRLIHSEGEARWIMYPSPVDLKVQLASPTTTTWFRKRFQITTPRQNLQLNLKAFGSWSLEINQQPVATRRQPGQAWRSEKVRVDVSRFLKTGENILQVSVGNRQGPPLLQVSGESTPLKLVSDQGWTVRQGSSEWVQAIVADDRRPTPESLKFASTFEVLSQKRFSILGLFVLSAALMWVFQRRRAALDQRSIGWLGGGLLVFWTYLFFRKMIHIDPRIGFDAHAHLNYIFFLIEHRWIPLASEGWAMYHPPLFYVVAALLAAGFQAGPVDLLEFKMVVGFLPFACGVGNALVVYFLTRKLFPECPNRQFLAVLTAGTLPLNLYMSSYLSNEPLYGFLAGLCLLVMLQAFYQIQTRFRTLLILGTLLGLALLTKFTALMLVLLAWLFIPLKLWWLERLAVRRMLPLLVPLIISPIVISGWFYLRNVIHYGWPLVFNWNRPDGVVQWWQQPGFRTPQYFLGFGQSLVRPYFSALESFWDGLYSTFWGDGLVGGRVTAAGRHDLWNYNDMTLLYLLATVASALILLGFAKMLRDSLVRQDPRLRLSVALLVNLVMLTGIAMLYYSLKVPIYSATKAGFGLSLVAPVSVAFAFGFEGLRRRLSARGWFLPGLVIYGWYGTWLATVILAFAG